jgi:hypothetical protein
MGWVARMASLSSGTAESGIEQAALRKTFLYVIVHLPPTGWEDGDESVTIGARMNMNRVYA